MAAAAVTTCSDISGSSMASTTRAELPSLIRVAFDRPIVPGG
jgi:hypothetical protein